MFQEVIAIVLDVGPSMNQAPPGVATPLETALQAITMILQRKVRQNCIFAVNILSHSKILKKY